MATQKNNDHMGPPPHIMYQHTIDAIDSLIHVVDKDLKIQLVNKEFLRWTRELGIKLPKFIGVDVFDVFPFLPNENKKEYQQVQKKGKILITEETRLIGNRELTVEVKKIPILENGRVTHIVTMVTDITARKQNQLEVLTREEKFRRLFEQSNDAIFLLSSEGIILDCNQKSSDLLEYPLDKIIGQYYKKFVVESYHTDSDSKFSQLKEGITPTLYEKEFRSASGRVIPVEINPTPVLDDAGNLKWIQSVVRDISERRRAEQLQTTLFQITEKTFTSRDLKQLYDAIHKILGQLMNVNNFYIAIYDPESKILSFPHFIDEQDPAPEPKKLGQGLTEYVLRTKKPLLLTREISEQLEKAREVELIGTDCVSWLGIPLKTSLGETFGVLVVQSYNKNIQYTEREKDILMFVSQQVATAIERKQTEEILRETEIQFHHLQKIESIGTLVGAIAHDYNNILTSILGNAQMLEYHIPAEKSPPRRYLEAIIKASESAASLVQQLLTFTKEDQPLYKTVNINKIIQEWREMLFMAVGDPIKIVTSLSQSIHYIRGNPEKIRQVIMNLIINARDAMPEGGKITIRTKNVHLKTNKYVHHNLIKAGSYVRMEIQDTGVGIENELISEIFKPFLSTKTRGKGTGLGLSIVKRIVDEMDAVITVDSKIGRGTTMSVYFPKIDTVHGHQATSEEKAILQGRGEVVLLVEDDNEVRAMLERMMTDYLGYYVLIAINGNEALEILAEKKVSLVITDLKMPDMDGLALLTAIKNDYSYLKNNIIAITAFAENEENQLLDMGFRAVFRKPIKLDHFSAAIREILDKTTDKKIKKQR